MLPKKGWTNKKIREYFAGRDDIWIEGTKEREGGLGEG